MGLGYRAPFHDDLIDGHPNIGWLEVITENYLWDTGVRRRSLENLREHYDIAFHGVSLSIAAPDAHDLQYLRKLKSFCDELAPVRVSDHLCWASTGGHFWHDLLPFPYTRENLDRLAKKVLTWQDILKRPLCLENLSAYVQSSTNEMSEYEFLAQLCEATDCTLLLDLNNMVVNAKNFDLDPYKELAHINLQSVQQIHLAGHVDGKLFAIDTHSKAPDAATWELFRHVSQRRPNIPYMIEWDSEIPSFTEVEGLLQRAHQLQSELP